MKRYKVRVRFYKGYHVNEPEANLLREFSFEREYPITQLKAVELGAYLVRKSGERFKPFWIAVAKYERFDGKDGVALPKTKVFQYLVHKATFTQRGKGGKPDMDADKE